METLERIKTDLINRILESQNEKLLSALAGIFDSTENKETIKLTSQQIEMLMMSEEDIENGRLISQEDLDKMDEKWLG